MERTVGQAIDDFIDAKQAENLSAKTLSWYRWLLEKFAASLDIVFKRTFVLLARPSTSCVNRSSY